LALKTRRDPQEESPLDAMICWKANLTDFASDLLCLVEDQIALANSDPGADQKATVAECAAAISCLKKRLATDEFELTLAMLVYSPLFTGDWLANWNNLAEAPVQEFKAGAAELLQGAKLLKDH
jgi:hypothetical protein